jgi:hypothetical protein
MKYATLAAVSLYCSLACACQQQLPDWSGWWRAVDGPGGVMLYRGNRELFQPAASKILDEFFKGTNIASHGEHCRPAAFVGHNGGFFDDVEFLFTPGRLTITNESGMLRRIDLDGRAMRSNPEESNAGTSVGRWGGRTLIVETVALKSTALFPENAASMATIGANVSVRERLSLNDQQELVIETELSAPEMLKSPLKFTVRYVRDSGHIVREHDPCTVSDRQIDSKTGLQQFDMTPPADLPPPPPRESN